VSGRLQLADRQRRLAASGLGGYARDADDVTEVEVDAAELVRPDEQLKPPAPVDQVEEHQLAHVAARHDPPREAMGAVGLVAGVEPLGLRPSRRYVDAVWKSLRERHRTSA
jgi:hypothetical protein